MEDLRALVARIRRLEEEVNDLREQVRAYQRSRWWRLHPRFAWRKLTRANGDAATNEPRVHAPNGFISVDERDPVSLRFHADVVSRGSFTEDWFTNEIPWLEALLAPLEGARARVLEVGSFEGLSTCFFLWRLPDAHVTAVDTFVGSVEHAGYGSDVSELESTFDRNVALVGASRVRKLVGDSRAVLPELIDTGARFDLVYVDGSHMALDVLVDAALSWQLLEDRGVLVFDDYTWRGLGNDNLLRPGPAIDAFLTLVAGKHELLHRDEQLALKRTD